MGTTTWSAGHYWIVKSFGGDDRTADLKKSMMADPKTVQAFQFIRDLEWKYKVQPSAAMVQGLGMTMETAFVSGKIAMHYGLNDLSFRFGEAIGDKFKWTVAPTPTGPAGRFQFSGGSAWCIPSTCTQKDLAYELIRYVLSNPELLPTTATMGGALVSNMEFAKFGLPPEELGISDAFQHAFIDLGAAMPATPITTRNIWSGNRRPTKEHGPGLGGEVEDVSVALAKADTDTQAILDSMQK